jgi:hypothetical protein
MVNNYRPRLILNKQILWIQRVEHILLFYIFVYEQVQALTPLEYVNITGKISQ